MAELPGNSIQESNTIGSRYTRVYTSFSGIDKLKCHATR